MENLNWDDWFYYDETSPSFLRWKIDRVSGKYKNHIHVKRNDVAGSKGSSGYYSVKLNNKLILCHRIIYKMCTKDTLCAHDKIDHIDQNKYNNSFVNLRKVSNTENHRNFPKRKDNTSGKVGITIISNGQGAWYCSANWNTVNGKHTNKRFSISKLGIMVAFRNAVAYRDKMIKELNLQGAGYTERHGKLCKFQYNYQAFLFK